MINYNCKWFTNSELISCLKVALLLLINFSGKRITRELQHFYNGNPKL